MHDEKLQHDGYRIPVYGGGVIKGHAVVDEGDRPLVEGRRWMLSTGGYACRVVQENGAPVSILMHRWLLGLQSGDGRETDHINRDRLDNRRANLRIVTHAQNMQNKSAYRNSTSPFRSVYWARDKRRWRAAVRQDGRAIHLGYFKCEVTAARVAEAWRHENMPFAQPDPELAKIDRAT